MISSLAPPSDLIPPCELNSSTAMSAPCRSSCPCRAQGPDSGAIIAILTDFACAFAERACSAGTASAPNAAPAYLVRAQPGDRLAGEGNCAAIGGEKPVDHIEQRRLAGAVRADDAVEPALRKCEVDAVERAQPAER